MKTRNKITPLPNSEESQYKPAIDAIFVAIKTLFRTPKKSPAVWLMQGSYDQQEWLVFNDLSF
jgi:hypothetical protein